MIAATWWSFRYLNNQFVIGSYHAFFSSKTLCTIKFYVGRHCKESVLTNCRRPKYLKHQTGQPWETSLTLFLSILANWSQMPTIVYCYRCVSSTDAVAVVSWHTHTHTHSLSLCYLALFPLLCVWYKNPFSHFISINWNTDCDSSACSYFKVIINTKISLISKYLEIRKQDAKWKTLVDEWTNLHSAIKNSFI